MDKSHESLLRKVLPLQLYRNVLYPE